MLPFLSLLPLLQCSSTVVESVVSYTICNELNLEPEGSVITHFITSDPVIAAGYKRIAQPPFALCVCSN